MSEYNAYDDPPVRRERRTRYRPRDYDEPEYVEETTFIERGKGPVPKELVLRQREDSVEDIHRDFPPPNSRRGPPSRYDDDYDDYPPPRRNRSHRGRYDDDDYSDDGYAAAGAAGGYAAARRRDRSRGPPRSDYYSDEDEPRRERRKSGIEKFAEGVGLGGVVGALAGKNNERARSRSRVGRYDDDSPPRSRDGRDARGGVKERQWAQAAQAALVSGAIEAFRVRNEPGGWGGERAKRIATAAIGAGAIDKVIDRDPDKKGTRHLVESVLGGLVANRLANGARDNGRSRSRGRDMSRSPGRSRSRSVFDRFRSKSRGRSASRGYDGSRSPPRSKSNGAGLAGLAGVGALAAGAKAWYDRARSKSRGPNERRRSTSSDRDYGRSRSRRRDVGRARSLPPDDRADSRAVDGPRGRAIGTGAGAGAVAAHNPNPDKRDASTSSESSNEIENKRKKMRGKELLTAGLASIATIHAAHGVYQSMEASEKRHKLVAEGEMSKEEARRKRSKAWLQDAAAIGIAALGIKGAYSEWKEMNEQRHSVKELEERRRKRAKRREQRMREARMNSGRPQGRLPASDGYYGSGGGGGYGDESLPPPPMGQTAGNYR